MKRCEDDSIQQYMSMCVCVCVRVCVCELCLSVCLSACVYICTDGRTDGCKPKCIHMLRQHCEHDEPSRQRGQCRYTDSTADSPVDLENVVIESTIGSENTCVRAQASMLVRARAPSTCMRAHTAAIAMPAKR